MPEKLDFIELFTFINFDDYNFITDFADFELSTASASFHFPFVHFQMILKKCLFYWNWKRFLFCTIRNEFIGCVLTKAVCTCNCFPEWKIVAKVWNYSSKIITQILEILGYLTKKYNKKNVFPDRTSFCDWTESKKSKKLYIALSVYVLQLKENAMEAVPAALCAYAKRFHVVEIVHRGFGFISKLLEQFRFFHSSHSSDKFPEFFEMLQYNSKIIRSHGVEAKFRSMYFFS